MSEQTGQVVPAPGIGAVATPVAKPWYASMTIWGGIITSITMVIQTTAQTLDANIGTHLAGNPIVTGVIACLGAVMAIIGRFSATQSIK